MNKTTIELLPTELWMILFQYFDVCELYAQFNGLNSRIDRIIQSVNNLCLRIDEANHIFYLEHIMPWIHCENVNSLSFLDDSKTYPQTEFFLLYPLEKFIERNFIPRIIRVIGNQTFRNHFPCNKGLQLDCIGPIFCGGRDHPFSQFYITIMIKSDFTDEVRGMPIPQLLATEFKRFYFHYDYRLNILNTVNKIVSLIHNSLTANLYKIISFIFK